MEVKNLKGTIVMARDMDHLPWKPIVLGGYIEGKDMYEDSEGRVHRYIRLLTRKERDDIINGD